MGKSREVILPTVRAMFGGVNETNVAVTTFRPPTGSADVLNDIPGKFKDLSALAYAVGAPVPFRYQSGAEQIAVVAVPGSAVVWEYRHSNYSGPFAPKIKP